jgi:UDP-N-acetyl-D-glucosamine dehydrogenase
MTTLDRPISTTANADDSGFRPEWISVSAEPSAPAFEYDVAIVGLGYVGLPTALAYHHAGSRVLGLDVSAARIAFIRDGKADLIPDDKERLSNAFDDPNFLLTDDPAQLSKAAAIIICVPTPVDQHLIPDLTLLRSACAMVVDRIVEGQLVMLTSTSYVGCTHDLVVAPLEARGIRVGADAFVAFSAERIDPGNEKFAHDDVPRVMGGATLECEEEAAALLGRYTGNVHRVKSLAAAEMSKLLENTFRAVNIALANEFADICRSLDIPVMEVINAASTKPYGFMPFTPGPGVGGHCIPCDPHYLLWQLRKDRIEAPMISQAMIEIAARPTRVVDRVRDVLAREGIGMTGARILVLGVSYKPDVADLRESPALEILEGLAENGAIVGYLDPHFDEVRLPNGEVLRGITEPVDFSADLVLIHTNHASTDVSWVTPEQIILDTTYRSDTSPHRVLL